jgi:hypothetical protein
VEKVYTSLGNGRCRRDLVWLIVSHCKREGKEIDKGGDEVRGSCEETKLKSWEEGGWY